MRFAPRDSVTCCIVAHKKPKASPVLGAEFAWPSGWDAPFTRGRPSMLVSFRRFGFRLRVWLQRICVRREAERGPCMPRHFLPSAFVLFAFGSHCLVFGYILDMYIRFLLLPKHSAVLRSLCLPWAASASHSCVPCLNRVPAAWRVPVVIDSDCFGYF